MPDLPRHIGYIIDGNRRWAKKHGLPTYEGHLAGYNALKEIVVETIGLGVPYVSIYAFSTENWKRGKGEVGRLMRLVHRLVSTDLDELLGKGIRLRFLGTEEGLKRQMVDDIALAQERSAGMRAGTVAVCFNYGGQREIADAARQCLRDGLSPNEIDEAALRRRLYAHDIPDIDMVVRTSGEQRLSNFMIWRSAYSELLFLDKFWPDMTKRDVQAIIDEYQKRQRRFGG
ncbi:MAG: di-trans,poly-cis-decaprenylcistransferase [Candidatus Chaera renei]|uniref:Isoprenyl transferase n=1 Tax=Candidatus Chaera renei TaxID=2506947 RepID=A0A4Q0AIU3_9BACT|nr:MAG: di-trans,poly-cis-decaprenylcistransferase [Candidatus Chaera renei]